MNEDLTLNAVLSFEETRTVFKDDGTPENISGWTIKGTVIIDKLNNVLDKPITGSFVTDGTDGQYKFSITDTDRDAIFVIYPKKSGLLYEVIGTKPDNTGVTLKQGILFLENSRPLSKAP